MREFTRERYESILNDESDTILFKENDLRTRYFDLFMKGLVNRDFSKFN